MSTKTEIEEDLEKIEEAIPDITVDSDYPWAADEDEERRCFIIGCVGATEYGISYLEEMFQWMKTGAVPAPPKTIKYHK